MSDTSEATPEIREHRLKRMKMRSMRRGIKEMDIILSHYADTRLDSMSDAELDHYDALLNENDQDLYQWVSHQADAPAFFQDLINDISQEMDRK